MSQINYGAIPGSSINEHKDELTIDNSFSEEAFPDSSIPIREASFKHFYDENESGSTSIIGSGIPSNIPYNLNKLYLLKNLNTDDLKSEAIAPFVLLQNKLDRDITLGDIHGSSGVSSGVCVELDTVGFTLVIGQGSTLAAL